MASAPPCWSRPARIAVSRVRQDSSSAVLAAQTSRPGEASRCPPRSEPSDEPTSFADGRYDVKELLGEGGKKLVYLAHDNTLDREVAFALIRTEGLDETSRTRITREAQAMGRLGAHPHIVTVFDLGEHEGQPYIVTELMGGGDVEMGIADADDNRLPLEQAIDIAKATCRGLEFAHSKGIVHRDLKPGNVWLTDGGTAKIGDFGLAVATDRSRLTQEGMMVGTVSYMPPEQAMGGEATPQADLYSLGAMLYEMVTGRPPFVGDDSVAIIGQHLNTPPVAPTWHNPDVPPALETLVLRLLEKDPASRPASAAQVLEALDAIDVGAPREAPSADTAPTGPDPTYRRTFVGREAELRQLHAAFDNAMSGEGALVMVVGEPGIGKTTLCEQLSTYATLRGGTTLIGHCYEEGSLSLPYLAFVEAMRSYVLSREVEELKKELGSGASEVARIVSEVRERVKVEPSASSDPDQDRYRLLQAVVSFLRNASTVQPLLIMLEDLHDADAGTLDMLSHVARNMSGARLLVVGTYRDVEVDRTHPLSGALAELRRVSAFVRVSLRGLTADEVQRMISAVAGRDMPWSMAEAVHRQTEGNPLFIQEVLRYLVEEGLVDRDQEGEWSGTGEQSLAMSIPEGLRDVIGRRLTRLSEECNRVSAIAAVIGREFHLDVLQRVADAPEEDLFAALEEAKGVGILEERSTVGAGVSFRFAHAFFRQTLYDEMFAPRRIRLHQQVGRALEEVHAGRLREHAAAMAEHFTQSTDREDLQKALEYGVMAAERSMAVYAYGEVSRLLDQALQVQEVLDPDDKPKRCDLLMSLAEALMPAGEPRKVMDAIAPEAFTLAEAVSDRARASRASRIALDAIVRFGSGVMVGSPEYLQWVERADRYAGPGTTDRVYADLRLLGLHRSEGKHTEARALVVRALELARKLQDPEALYFAAEQFLISPLPPDREEERLELVREMGQRSQSEVTLGSLVLGSWLIYGGSVLMDWGDRAGAEAMWEQLSQLAERTNDAGPMVQSLVAKSWLAYLDGRLDEAVSGANDLLRTAEELGAPVRGRGFASLTSMLPLLHMGRGEEAEEALAALGEAAESAGVETESLLISLRRALTQAHLGQTAEAGEALQGLVAEPRFNFEDENLHAYVLVGLLETAILVGDRELCSVLAERLDPVAHMSMAFYANTCPARHLGAAAALLGAPDRARDYYNQALEAAGKIRFRPEIALTRLQLAELLLDHYPDERAEALEHLDFAIGELRDMKMQPALERALSRREILEA